MKKLFQFLFIALIGASMTLTSCDDDDSGGGDPDRPTITAPNNPVIGTNESVTLTFTVSAPGGFATATTTAAGGTAVVDSQPAAGANNGDVVVTYTAGATATVGTLTLTVTDDNGKTDAVSIAVTIANIVRQTTNIDADVTWTADKTYVLGGRITVLDGVTLTIEAGTVIKGEAGTGSNSTALLVARGGTLNANGTAAAPIIFTSVADEITPEDVAGGDFQSPNLDPDINGLWGGVLILGRAPISAQNDNDEDVTELQIEGIPTSDPNGLYGGNDPTDNSGTITYISIRHGGTLIGSGNEINGLTLGGVGNGTTISNVEVVANQDDGIEWFGGSVDVTNALVWNAGDDAIDTDQAWDGSVSNFIVVNPADNCFELDGPEGTFTNDNHVITNGTVYAGGADQLVDFDASSDVDMSSVYFYGLAAGQTVEEYANLVVGTATDFETTLDGLVKADVFVDMPDAEVVEVAANANTVGPTDDSDFEWTWASQSGALAGIGL